MQTLYVKSHEWLSHHSPRSQDMELLDVLDGQRLQSGTVLGRVAATGRLVKHDSAASNGSQAPVAILGNPQMDGVAGTFPVLVYGVDSVVFPGALNGGEGISAPTAAQLKAIGIRMEGPTTAALPGAGAGVGEISLDAPPTPTAPTTSPPVLFGTPTVGTVVLYSSGGVTGVPAPTVTHSLTVGGVAKTLPYTPVLADVGLTLVLTQTAANGVGPAANATASATVVSGVIAPTVISAPAIIGTPQVGVAASYTPAVFGGSASTVTRQWTLDGADIIGATAATYTPVATGALRVRETATNAAGSVSSTSAPVTVQAAPAGDTRPRSGIGAASFNTTQVASLAAMTAVPGSTNGGKAGTFTVTTTPGNYGWLATTNAGAPVFTDTSNNLQGGWQLIGSNVADGSTWFWWRQDFPNASPSGSTFTIA